MKQEFSTKWIGSKQPRKQRKYIANAPLHIRHKLISAHLSKAIKEKYGKRSFPLKKEDSVKIMVGEFKGKTGKVDVVNLAKLRVSITGVNRLKKDGSKVSIWFNPSNLQITELNLEDKKRRIALERKGKVGSSKESDENSKNTKKEFKKLPKTEKSEDNAKSSKNLMDTEGTESIKSNQSLRDTEGTESLAKEEKK